MWSDRGEAEVWMTNTSEPRTFSSIFTLMFSLENRVMRRRPSGTFACLAMARASAGWLLPAKIFSERLKGGPYLTRVGSPPRDIRGQTARGLRARRLGRPALRMAETGTWPTTCSSPAPTAASASRSPGQFQGRGDRVIAACRKESAELTALIGKGKGRIESGVDVTSDASVRGAGRTPGRRDHRHPGAQRGHSAGRRSRRRAFGRRGDPDRGQRPGPPAGGPGA